MENSNPSQVLKLQLSKRDFEKVEARLISQLFADASKFDLFFRSANGVPPNERISVPTAEWRRIHDAITLIKELHGVYRKPDEAAHSECWCEKCAGASAAFTGRMALCPDCGNKRCPKATHHDNACTGSNEPGQKGSSWENYPRVSATS